VAEMALLHPVVEFGISERKPARNRRRMPLQFADHVDRE